MTTLAAAKALAIAGIRDMLAAEVLTGRIDMSGRIDIVNCAGTTVLAVSFGEALEIKGTVNS